MPVLSTNPTSTLERRPRPLGAPGIQLSLLFEGFSSIDVAGPDPHEGWGGAFRAEGDIPLHARLSVVVGLGGRYVDRSASVRLPNGEQGVAIASGFGAELLFGGRVHLVSDVLALDAAGVLLVNFVDASSQPEGRTNIATPRPGQECSDPVECNPDAVLSGDRGLRGITAYNADGSLRSLVLINGNGRIEGGARIGMTLHPFPGSFGRRWGFAAFAQYMTRQPTLETDAARDAFMFGGGLSFRFGATTTP